VLGLHADAAALGVVLTFGEAIGDDVKGVEGEIDGFGVIRYAGGNGVDWAASTGYGDGKVNLGRTGALGILL